MSHIYSLLGEHLKKKTPLALATIIGAKGSVPQTAGASALISGRKLLAGTVGGGALEAEVLNRVPKALANGAPVVLDFRLKGKVSQDDEAVCGGEARVLIDPRPSSNREAFEAVGPALAAGRPGVLVTVISGAALPKAGLRRFWVSRPEGENEADFSAHPGFPGAGYGADLPGLDKLQALFRNGIRRALAERRPVVRQLRKAGRRAGSAETILFFEPVFPPFRLVIAGAGHIGQAVCLLGHFLDFEVTVIDDRPEFAGPERLPGAERIIRDDFRRVFRSLPLTPDTFLVIVTRGHRHDADVLRAAIRSQAAYIGMIGSRDKIGQMRKRFLDRGWATAEEWNRVHAPIGLPIRSKTVAEIAVSIAAELVSVRREILTGLDGRR